MDELDPWQNPRCPTCHTVMRDDPRGFECVTCGTVHLRDGGRFQRIVDAG